MTATIDPERRTYYVNRTIVDFEALYDWLAETGTSVSSFCRALGILRSSFYSWGRGTSPCLMMRKRIMARTGLPYEILFHDTDKRQQGRVVA